MWIALAVTVALWPQDPGFANSISALHDEQRTAATAAAAYERVAADIRPKLRGIDAPIGVTVLRAAGLSAVDVERQRLRFDENDDLPAALLESTASRWSKRVPKVKVKRLDLRGFENVCEHAYRDIMGAVGSGRDIQTEAAKLHAVLDRMRFSGATKGWDDPTRELIEARVRRITKVDHDELLTHARRITLSALTLGDEKLLKKMRRQDPGSSRRGVKGDVLDDREGSFGRIVIGGFGDNEYDCAQIDVIVDLGGNDVYRGPAGGTGEQQRLAVVVDVAGDDRYQALNGALGSGTFGVGVLVDMAGDDLYRGGERCLGFGAAGVGVFLDLAGRDDVEVGGMSCGAGIAGIGVCLDLAGADKQVAGSESFGCGLPGGLGVFVDAAGDDVRTIGEVSIQLGAAANPFSIGFGAGAGAAPFLAAGLGVCFDAAGNDSYTGQGLVLGAGTSGGCGVFRDAAGDDTYTVGIASLGAAFGRGVGVAIDDAGDDVHTAGALSFGSGLGDSAAWFAARGGNDRYTAGPASFGVARRGSIAAFLEIGGDDTYERHAGELGWPVGASERAGDAIGVMLDDGGTNDQFVGFDAPPTATTQMLETDRPDGLERWIVVSR